MLLVIDSNVLFTYFWKDSFTRDLLTKHKLISPELSLREIKKYESEILIKSGISKQEFSSLREQLILLVDFIPVEQYAKYLRDAESLSKCFSNKDKKEFLNDVDFFALALKLNCPIWSNDRLFKKQSKVDVFNTREVIELTTPSEVNSEE